jgi:hypothetical protein
MNYYKQSDGTRISKQQIDRNVTRAKGLKVQNQLNGHGWNFCEKCQAGEIPSANDEHRILDCAHIISVDECQKTGRSELAWDLDNIRILCRYHHKQHDGLDLKFTK